MMNIKMLQFFLPSNLSFVIQKQIDKLFRVEKELSTSFKSFVRADIFVEMAKQKIVGYAVSASVLQRQRGFGIFLKLYLNLYSRR